MGRDEVILRMIEKMGVGVYDMGEGSGKQTKVGRGEMVGVL